MRQTVKFVENNTFEMIRRQDGASDSHHETSVSEIIFEGKPALHKVVYQPATGRKTSNVIYVLDPQSQKEDFNIRLTTAHEFNFILAKKDEKIYKGVIETVCNGFPALIVKAFNEVVVLAK